MALVLMVLSLVLMILACVLMVLALVMKVLTALALVLMTVAQSYLIFTDGFWGYLLSKTKKITHWLTDSVNNIGLRDASASKNFSLKGNQGQKKARSNICGDKNVKRNVDSQVLFPRIYFVEIHWISSQVGLYSVLWPVCKDFKGASPICKGRFYLDCKVYFCLFSKVYLFHLSLCPYQWWITIHFRPQDSWQEKIL